MQMPCGEGSAVVRARRRRSTSAARLSRLPRCDVGALLEPSVCSALFYASSEASRLRLRRCSPTQRSATFASSTAEVAGRAVVWCVGRRGREAQRQCAVAYMRQCVRRRSSPMMSACLPPAIRRRLPVFRK